MRTLIRVMPALALAGLLFSCASGGAVSAAEIDMDAVMNKMMEMGQPTEHHAHLAQFAGDWNAKMTYVMKPGDPEETMEGTSKFEMILDGHYLRHTFQGEFMGQPFSGEGTTGFDTTAGSYYSTWMDSMSTFMMPLSTGQCSDNGKTITFTSTWDNPFMGVQQHGREIWETQDINHFTFIMFISWNGQDEYQHMKIEYARK